jgi:hypothetical protein
VRGREVGDEEVRLGIRKRVFLPPPAFRLLPLQVRRAPDDELDAAILDRARLGLDAMQRARRDCASRLALDPTPEIR